MPGLPIQSFIPHRRICCTLLGIALFVGGCQSAPTQPKLVYLDANGQTLSAMPTVEELQAMAPPGAIPFSVMVDARDSDPPFVPPSPEAIGDLLKGQTGTRVVIQRIDFQNLAFNNTFKFWDDNFSSVNGRYRIPGLGPGVPGGVIFLGHFDNGEMSWGLSFPLSMTSNSLSDVRWVSLNSDVISGYAVLYGYVY